MIYAILISYLLGSIPFSLIYSYVFHGIDIRTIGSGNAGATNAFRLGGMKLAALTFISDAGKGALAVWLFPEYKEIAGLFAIMGHIFSVWLKFKGGKGFATVLGVLGILSPLMALSLILIWAAIFFAFHISGLASITAAFWLPVLTSVIDIPFWWAFVVSVLIIYAHKKNIQEIMIKILSRLVIKL